MPTRVIRAAFTDQTVRVYQAYRSEIALPALGCGRLVAPFKMSRMTWIKPSFNWMMYRSGYATKPGQEYILGIDITCDGFNWALRHAALSAFDPAVHASPEEWHRSLAASPVRIQWDPERDWRLHEVKGIRTIQIGLAGEAVRRYVEKWIVAIEDLTPIARQIAAAVSTGLRPPHLPDEAERPYPFRDAAHPSSAPETVTGEKT